MTEQVRKELPPEVMAHVIEHARAGQFVDALVAIYREFGHDLHDPDCEPFKAWDCAIPQPQWEAICGELTHTTVHQSPLRSANLAMDWINSGPSSYPVVE